MKRDWANCEVNDSSLNWLKKLVKDGSGIYAPAHGGGSAYSLTLLSEKGFVRLVKSSREKIVVPTAEGRKYLKSVTQV